MKKIIYIVAFFFTTLIWSQVDYSNRWEDFYAYNNVKDFVKVNNTLYCLVDNAVFTYSITSGTVEKISSVHGLSGETTTSIYYSETHQKLMIGYKTGLLEIIDNNRNITIAKDIVNFNYSGNKQINNIVQHGNNLYLSTGFAVVVYNIEKLQFGDTYFIGNQSSEVEIHQIKIHQNTLYAITEAGLFTADVSNPNLIDSQNWTLQYLGNFTAITVFNNNVYLAKEKSLYRIENNVLVLQKTYAQTIESIKSSSNYLTVSSKKNVFVINENFVTIAGHTALTNSTYNYNLNTAFTENNSLYLASQTFGILKSKLSNISNFEEIHPKGPSTNAPFSIAANNQNLWVVYGGYDKAYGPLGKKLGYSHYNGTAWVNKPHNATYNIKDLVHITIDPNHENKVYISSWGDGMLVVENNEIVSHWNHTNSGLEKLDYPDPNYISIRINGAAFDTQGNLWIANAWVDKKIKKYNANSNWSGFDMSAVTTEQIALGLNEIAIDKTTNIWLGTRRNGLLVFNENGLKKRALTTEQTKGFLPDLNVRTVKIDSKNRVWIGTKKGLVVYNNAANIFNENTIQAQPIVILDDGIPKKLLGTQTVNTIAVDGANNKWFGTETGGVTQTNYNGENILQQFNKNNSPLPSNTILKIAIARDKGTVFFATSKGIVAYKSHVAAYGENLPAVYAYPNPATKNNEYTTIDGRNGAHLPKGTNIKIVDTAGNLVYETNINEAQALFGGKVRWNKKNLAGKKVASGIYIALLTANEHSQSTFVKIAIVN